MRVALVTDWFLPRLGGIELHVRDLARELVARGHDVDVVTTAPVDPSLQGGLQADPRVGMEGGRVHRLDLPLLPGAGLTLSPWAVRSAGELLGRIEPDVVHVHAGLVPPLALASGYAAHRRGLPVIATVHSVLGRLRAVWRLSERLLGWAAWTDQLTAVGPGVAREVEEVVRDRTVPVLPNGILASYWAAPEGAAESRTCGELRLVSVMRLQRRKRGRALIDAFAGAVRRLNGERRVSLTVVGDGPRRSDLERRARRLGVADRVRFDGYLPRESVRSRLARADAFVLASVRESFGLSALEARAAGLAVVARRDSGVGAHLEDGRGALLVADDREMVDALVRLGREPELLAALRRHNRRTPSPHDWERVVRRHRLLYARARAARAARAGA